MVIDVSKKHLPSLAAGYSSPKLTTHFEDGATFMDRYNEEFDIIITDCSDYDTGTQYLRISVCIYFWLDTSKDLYEQPYYEKVKKALKPDGVICSLGNFIYIIFFPFVYIYVCR